MDFDLYDTEARIVDGIYGDDRMTRKQRDEAMAALAALVAEVERLRGVTQIAVESAVAEERAAVVAALGSAANAPHPIEHGVPALSPAGRGLLLLWADRIERGEHRRKEEK